jgi:hypothetical protein
MSAANHRPDPTRSRSARVPPGPEWVKTVDMQAQLHHFTVLADPCAGCSEVVAIS